MWLFSHNHDPPLLSDQKPGTIASHQSPSAEQPRFLDFPVPYRQITDVSEYRLEDIRPNDRVVDIGANVGAFCIRAAQYSRYVVAVEPVTAEILLENIRINGVAVKVVTGGLGDGKLTEIGWDGCHVLVPTYTLKSLIRIAGGCDFLKCDCEGAEWLIDPRDLAEVRRIEMELHLPPISGPVNPALLDFISKHYNFEIERKPCHSALGVMGILHAEQR